MYIAFKWLLGLALTMWAAMCYVDVFPMRTMDIDEEESITKPFGLVYKNFSIQIPRSQEVRKEKWEPKGMAVLHCAMFLAGALAVCIFNKKKDIITFANNKITKINIGAVTGKLRTLLKKAARGIRVTILKYSWTLWETSHLLVITVRNKYHTNKRNKVQLDNTVKSAIIKKMKEIGEEKRNLGQLLISAIHENKTIRMQYQLEMMAKNRLARHIENTQKEIKENRSTYISFQQLYLVTHQENIFLNARIRKLTKEKEEAEKNLMGLMNEIYKSKNNELKAYCSRFVVTTKDNLLNSDVKAEIHKFLQNTRRRRPGTTASNRRFSDLPDLGVNTTKSWPGCTNTHLTEILQDDSLVPLISDAPKLKGLPGEYVWTIKDKDGIIEKLYEYDYESDYNNGDTIRRIRQYSVYYDKDCLLDFSNSRTIVHEINENTSRLSNQHSNLNYTLANEKFLTGSEAFQKFLQTNKNVLSTNSRSSTSLLLSR